MSCNSGLMSYKEFDEYLASMNLSYNQLANPNCLLKDPLLFYGFWCSCIKDYKEKKPHRGYEILLKWKEKYFSSDGAHVDERKKKIYRKFYKKQKFELNQIFGDEFASKEKELGCLFLQIRKRAPYSLLKKNQNLLIDGSIHPSIIKKKKRPWRRRYPRPDFLLHLER